MKAVFGRGVWGYLIGEWALINKCIVN